jgi:exodeoxyribonuclease VII large subunit
MASFALKVSELTGQIKTLLEENFSLLWIEGEISNLTLHSTGHYFFSLKDERAQVRAVMFRFQASHLPFRPENGTKVIVRGRISVYEPRGEYQILVDAMEPLGKGSLQAAFEHTKKKLAAEGLFDPGRKRALPLLPQRIGVITSPTGAAIRDILRIVDQRFANVEMLIIPVRVQGPEAPAEIVAALALVNELDSLDVVILARGGGSIEDLWAFNDEAVARAIAQCRVPVVSAVGHEIDFTISDFVADVRAATPSAAAELVVEKKEYLLTQVGTLGGRLEQRLGAAMEIWSGRVEMFERGLKDPRKKFADLQLRADDLTQRVRNSCPSGLRMRTDHWKHAHVRLLSVSPLEAAKIWREGLAGKQKSLLTLTRWKWEREAKEVEKLMAQLDAASPLNILKRGYSITSTWPERKIVREAAAIKPLQTLHLALGKGEVLCTVDKTIDGGSDPA